MTCRHVDFILTESPKTVHGRVSIIQLELRKEMLTRPKEYYDI